MRTFIHSYNGGSESAKTLSELLGAPRIKAENSKYVGGKGKLVINWGSSGASEAVLRSECVLNNPENVGQATNKLTFFQIVQDHNDGLDEDDYDLFVNIPEWTSDPNEVRRWAERGNTAVCRTVLQGHSGEGIILYTPEMFAQRMAVPAARLYTMYIKKKYEYRVHVMGENVIDVQRKIRNTQVADENINWQIRNHDNGFVYARQDNNLGRLPAGLNSLAINTVHALGLDFGAVDIIHNERENATYVLEVNTAPGMQGETGHIYAREFQRLIAGRFPGR